MLDAPNWIGLSFIAGLALCWATPTHAQTVRDKAKKHVGDELDDKKRKKRRSPSDGRTRRRQGRSASDGAQPTGPTYTLSLADDPILARGVMKLPRRLFPRAHNYLRVDLELDAAYRGWLAQQYDSAEVDIASFATWRAGVKGRFFRYLSLFRGYYESTGLHSPRNTKAALASKVGTRSHKGAKALAYFGLTFWKRFHPMLRYEAQAFQTEATPKIPVCIVGREDSVDAMSCPRTMDKLRVVSSYETLVAGLRVALPHPSRNILASKEGTVPPFYVGLGLMSYSKPYQINVDGATLEEFLFDGRFRGAGLAMGTQLGGGPQRFFGGVDMQIGLGEVQLTDDFTLNEVTPDDWLIGYIQGNLRGGYELVVFKGPPTITIKPELSIGGASFHFVSTSGEADSAPSLNWDLLWSARVSVRVFL